MINLTEVHQFNTPFISAASGLVATNDSFFIIADDELSLLQVSRNNFSGKTYPLFPGSLPDKKEDRKKIKPDLECLTLTAKGLLAIPSGSRPNRTRGALIHLKDQSVTGQIEQIDFSLLYQKLTQNFNELNIEGAVVIDEKLRLFQRGNGVQHQNGIIDVDLHDLSSIGRITNISLGELDQVPLSFTDATLHGNKIFFLAVAEDTRNTYDDGVIHGSIIGIMTLDGKVEKMIPINCKSKPEGITIIDNFIYVVTDDDDRTRPSKLLRAPFNDIIR